MSPKELKRSYGEEYPAAVVSNGLRMPLVKERHFSRSYSAVEEKKGMEISRFMDGSASMTLEQLQSGWTSWGEDERVDFCNSCCWLHKQSDYPEILRFIVQHGSPRVWPAIAMLVAVHLPQDEAFDFLHRTLISSEAGKGSNFIQGIGLTKHPNAESTLRRHLQSVWANSNLWDDDDFLNWVTYDAMNCILYVIELGAPTSDFEDQVRQLSQHRCRGNRESSVQRLSKHYSWLK